MKCCNEVISQVWPSNKDVQYCTVTLFSPSFQYRTWMSISFFCMLSFRDSSYKIDINGDFKISSKIICLKCGNKPWLITILQLGSARLKLWWYWISLAHMLKNIPKVINRIIYCWNQFSHNTLPTQHVPHLTILSKNGKWTVCITAIPQELMMK